MIKIGLTGNIGSGKTTVAKIFETLGVPIFYADIEARKFLSEKDVLDKLVNEFGNDILSDDNLDRGALAKIVFNDKAALETLNSIIHPRVRQSLMDWMSAKQDHKYVIQEAAILFESGFYIFFDKNIIVSCPEDVAIKRVMKRDGIGENDVRARIQNQWPEQKKIQLADYVILNDNTNLVIPQVLSIHKELSI